MRLSWGWLSSLGKAVSEGNCREDKCMGVHADGLTADGFVCGWAHVHGPAYGWACVRISM